MAQQIKNPHFNPWVRKIPWKRECLPSPVFLPGESPGQRSPVGYSLWGHRVGHNSATNIHSFNPIAPKHRYIQMT